MFKFDVLKDDLFNIKEWLSKEYSAIHVGRATPAILDRITVDSYGAQTSISHIASISVEDARTLRVAPWDKSQMKDIEKAIVDSSLGLGVAVDDQGIRLSFPDLSSERREALVKVAKSKLEEARISIRKEREKAWGEIQNKEKAGEISEDDKFKLKDELQKIVEQFNKELEEIKERKEKEIL